MNSRVEPDWIDLDLIGSPYEQQLDVRAAPDAPAHLVYRYRLRSFTGQLQDQWSPGPAPPEPPSRTPPERTLQNPVQNRGGGKALSLGAGGGNRTRTRSLGSGRFLFSVKGLRAKPGLAAVNEIKSLRGRGKTFETPPGAARPGSPPGTASSISGASGSTPLDLAAALRALGYDLVARPANATD